MAGFNLEDHPHRRYNPLTGEWVLVSPHRAKRPWQGQVEKDESKALPDYDPECYLCPGNTRAGGKENPAYTDTFIFTNDFSSLLPDTPDGKLDESGLFIARSERGIAKVICFSPRHDLTVPLMDIPDIRKVIDLWVTQYEALGALDIINHVQIFENKGSMMGCSNPHPHCQIWAQSSIPVEVTKEQKNQSAYFEENGRTLLSDYLAMEQEKNERIIYRNDSFTALVPFWATWPFEAMIIANRPVNSLPELNDPEKTALADCYKALTVRYDNLFRTSFPYSMGFHQAPVDGKPHPEWHLHMHFYPPLLRSATVKKFMVGYEMMANPQRDFTAEQSANRLREQSGIHYKAKQSGKIP
ncbi:MAG: UDP-glucose--hexose-1-phosphate uridylyltransferase [Bacteroidales bacterium]|nr:UDP-glucose--hexose-1-phosphate uridylyltransferase [Bacteroidales bacterium]